MATKERLAAMAASLCAVCSGAMVVKLVAPDARDAMSGKTAPSGLQPSPSKLDHLVGTGEQRRQRNRREIDLVVRALEILEKARGDRGSRS